MKKNFDSYHNLISLENLFQAFAEFKKGKRGKKDVGEFLRQINLI